MFNLDASTVYDCETFPNVFTLHMEMLANSVASTWEISHYRDDRRQLMEWFNWLREKQIAMIGFNNLHFDYPVIHYIYCNPMVTVEQIYAKAMEIIKGGDRFAHTIWERDRFAPQIDLFKINHFDNKAKTTSLKALQINMRTETVEDMPVEVGTMLGHNEVNGLLIPYNKSDTTKTKLFAKYCRKALEFRVGLLDKIDGDVMNFNDTKIGAKLLEQRLGDDLCYDRSTGRKVPRQTIRHEIALKDIIFPYVKFNNPEFQRVLEWLKGEVLTAENIEDGEGYDGTGIIKTKGVFNGLSANVGGLDFHFGTGGIHASVPAQRIVADDTWLIRDIDVTGLYPSIGIVNQLAPAHLGQPFVVEYAKLPEERSHWQKTKGKKCVEANSLKLAGNGTYGNTNNRFSVFYDPQYTMTITINGQLMLCMLAEWLTTVPTLQIIQANTDGITYRIHKDYEPQAAELCKQWSAYTMLKLEDVSYRRMWIRDVNNYIAEDLDGNLKQKGAYWHPDPLNYADSISEAQPPAWHKDLSNIISIRAAVAAMVHGVNPETFIRAHSNPYDFMIRAKVNRSDKLMLGDAELQKTSRYYVAKNGAPLVKISPPTKGNKVGDFRRANKLSDQYFNSVMAEIGPNVWDARIHTKNKSRYEMRHTGIQAGWKIAECNNVKSFDFDNLNYDYYVAEAAKLII